ncbi:MAG TPA: hypothetical protein VNT77_08000 [Allosphingosinicella sp.]|nr:hypothetical protein [Allosphingosinicella sp.]
MRLLPLMLLLSGCAYNPPPGGNADDALARELAGQTAGPAQRCVPTISGSGLQVAGRQTLVYRQGATTWVSRLSEGCPGFQPFDTLVVEVHSSQYCEKDRVRSVPPGGGIAGPTCLLGEFVPYRRP